VTIVFHTAVLSSFQSGCDFYVPLFSFDVLRNSLEKFFYLQQSFLPAFLAFLIAKNATNPIKPKPTIISIILIVS